MKNCLFIVSNFTESQCLKLYFFALYFTSGNYVNEGELYHLSQFILYEFNLLFKNIFIHLDLERGVREKNHASLLVVCKTQRAYSIIMCISACAYMRKSLVLGISSTCFCLSAPPYRLFS